MLIVKNRTPKVIIYNNKNVSKVCVKKNSIVTTVWEKTSDIARFGYAVFGTSRFN